MKITLYDIVRGMGYIDWLSIARLVLLLIVCLTGVIFAIARWKRHRGISAFTIIILTINAFVGTTITAVRFYWIESETQKILDIGGEDRFMQMALRYHGIYNILLISSDILHLLTIAFLLIVIFVGRPQKGTPS